MTVSTSASSRLVLAKVGISSAGETLYLADAGVMAERLAGSGGVTQWTNYLFAGSEMIGMRVERSDGSTYTRYFHKDHLGSIATITDETGAVVERLSYDAWGKRRFPNGQDDPTGSISSQTTRGFTGQEELADVGLVHMNGRVYDPLLGRFGTPDPTTENPFSTQGWNRYSYVGNSPLNFTDPSVINTTFSYDANGNLTSGNGLSLTYASFNKPETIRQIAALYKIEEHIRGQSAEQRRDIRNAQARPLVDAFKTWLDATLARVSGGSKLADVIRYAIRHWQGLIRFLDDGRIEIDSNTVERSMRSIALTRKNALFAGHDRGGVHWGVIASLIETCKINAVDP